MSCRFSTSTRPYWLPASGFNPTWLPVSSSTSRTSEWNSSRHREEPLLEGMIGPPKKVRVGFATTRAPSFAFLHSSAVAASLRVDDASSHSRMQRCRCLPSTLPVSRCRNVCRMHKALPTLPTGTSCILATLLDAALASQRLNHAIEHSIGSAQHLHHRHHVMASHCIYGLSCCSSP